MMGEALIAPCGLDCSKCDIYRARSEPVIMAEVLEWFERERNLRLKPEQIRCGTCLGDRSRHWSPGCGILKCCVDDKGFMSCAECRDMPCEQLESFAARSKRYADAVARLKSTRLKGI